MTFSQRLPYYLVGFFIGCIFVYFIYTKKNASFAYLPNARVLKNISTKKQLISDKVKIILQSKKIDTVTINQILKNGDVDMWNKIKTDTCFQYNITGRKNLNNIVITVKNCDSTAFIEKVTFLKPE